MTDEASHSIRDQGAAPQAAREHGGAERLAREYPNPDADRPASPQREADQGRGYVAPSAKSLAEAEARERAIVGRDGLSEPPAPQPHPHNPYAEYERRWGHELGGRER